MAVIAKGLPRSLTFHLRCAVEQLACGTAQWQGSPRLGSATDKITHSLSRVSGELLDRATNHGGLKTDGASGMNPRAARPLAIPVVALVLAFAALAEAVDLLRTHVIASVTDCLYA
jgi:hypothetical protein